MDNNKLAHEKTAVISNKQHYVCSENTMRINATELLNETVKYFGIGNVHTEELWLSAL